MPENLNWNPFEGFKAVPLCCLGTWPNYLHTCWHCLQLDVKFYYIYKVFLPPLSLSVVQHISQNLTKLTLSIGRMLASKVPFVVHTIAHIQNLFQISGIKNRLALILGRVFIKKKFFISVLQRTKMWPFSRSHWIPKKKNKFKVRT